jgi:hypothetical protein
MSEFTSIVGRVATILSHALAGNGEAVALEAVELALDMVPVEGLRDSLTEAAARRANAVADAAEEIKFP